MIKQTDNKILSVPQQVFDRFLKELETQEVPEEVVAHLKKTLVDNGQISIKALKVALFSNDNTSV